jgi:hypothetical protein
VSVGRRGSALVALTATLLLPRVALAEEAPDAESATDQQPAEATPNADGATMATAPRSVDVLLLAVGPGTEGMAIRMAGGATPLALGPVAFGGRAVMGLDAALDVLGDSGRTLIGLYPRAAVGTNFGWSRVEAGLGLGAVLWDREERDAFTEDVRRESGISPTAELTAAWLFGGRGDIGPELRAESIGVDTFSLVLGLRIGGRVFD